MTMENSIFWDITLCTNQHTPPALCRFIIWPTLRPWRWRWCSSETYFTFAGLHSVILKTTEIFLEIFPCGLRFKANSTQRIPSPTIILKTLTPIKLNVCSSLWTSPLHYSHSSGCILLVISEISFGRTPFKVCVSLTRDLSLFCSDGNIHTSFFKILRPCS
jgi:hypothetical protein